MCSDSCAINPGDMKTSTHPSCSRPDRSIVLFITRVAVSKKRRPAPNLGQRAAGTGAGRLCFVHHRSNHHATYCQSKQYYRWMKLVLDRLNIRNIDCLSIDLHSDRDTLCYC